MVITQSTFNEVASGVKGSTLSIAARDELASLTTAQWLQLPSMDFAAKAMVMMMWAIYPGHLLSQSAGVASIQIISSLQGNAWYSKIVHGRTVAYQLTPTGVALMNTVAPVKGIRGFPDAFMRWMNALYPASSDPFKEFLLIAAIVVAAAYAAGAFSGAGASGAGAGAGAGAGTGAGAGAGAGAGVGGSGLGGGTGALFGPTSGGFGGAGFDLGTTSFSGYGGTAGLGGVGADFGGLGGLGSAGGIGSSGLGAGGFTGALPGSGGIAPGASTGSTAGLGGSTSTAGAGTSGFNVNDLFGQFGQQTADTLGNMAAATLVGAVSGGPKKPAPLPPAPASQSQSTPATTPAGAGTLLTVFAALGLVLAKVL